MWGLDLQPRGKSHMLYWLRKPGSPSWLNLGWRRLSVSSSFYIYPAENWPQWSQLVSKHWGAQFPDVDCLIIDCKKVFLRQCYAPLLAFNGINITTE